MDMNDDPGSEGQPPSEAPGHFGQPDQAGGPACGDVNQTNRATGQLTDDRRSANGSGELEQDGNDINMAAVVAYRASIKVGVPLSERKLAAMFGKTSRRWARNRMAEARRATPALAGSSA
jgi:hypothetical protein